MRIPVLDKEMKIMKEQLAIAINNIGALDNIFGYCIIFSVFAIVFYILGTIGNSQTVIRIGHILMSLFAFLTFILFTYLFSAVLGI